jgi:hypothetical protein
MTDRERADRKAKRLMMSGFWQHVDRQRRALMAPQPRRFFLHCGEHAIARLSNERDIRAYARVCNGILADYGLAD